MNIVYIAKEYPPYGGTYATALFYPKLADALVERGHRVQVISQAPDGEARCLEDKGVIVHRIGPGPRRGNPATRLLYNLSAWRKLDRIASREHVDIVDAPVSYGEGFFFTFWKRAPVVLQTFAFSDMFLETRSYSGLAELAALRVSALLEQATLRRADRIVANSPLTYRYVTEKMRIPRERTSLIWECRIDLNAFRPVSSDARARLGIATDAPLILYVGWLQPRKGAHILMQAFGEVAARFPKAVVAFVGRDTSSAPRGGSFQRYLLDYARDRNLDRNVRIITEFLPQEDLVKLYSACDVLVLPSLSETFGWPIFEAMACARPVVATATGIAPELAGLSPALSVVPTGDAGALAEAIIQILAMPRESREALSARHRTFVEVTFHFPRTVDSILDVYRDVLLRSHPMAAREAGDE